MVADDGLQIAALVLIQRAGMSRIGQFFAPRLLRRSWFRRSLLLRILGLLFAATLQAARNRCAFAKGVGGVGEFVEFRERESEHEIIGRIGVRRGGDGLGQFGDGSVVILFAEIDQAQAAVRLRFGFGLGFVEVCVGGAGHGRWLGQSGQDFQRVLFVFFCLGEFGVGLRIVGVVGMGNDPTGDDQHADVVRVQGDGLVAIGEHFVVILLFVFGVGHLRIDRSG